MTRVAGDLAYHEPASVAEAVALLEGLTAGDDPVTVMAGGVEVALQMKGGRVPAHLVSLRRVAGLADVRSAVDGLWLGATATHRTLETSAAVAAYHPVLAAMFGGVGSVRIRHQGTVGGCLAAADPAHDPPVLLAAFGAVVQVAGERGSARAIPVESVATDRGQTGLAAGEIVVGVQLPTLTAPVRAAYLRFRPGSADDASTVTVAVVAQLAGDGTIGALRVVVGAVGPTVVRARSVETALIGRRPDTAAWREAASLVRDEVHPVAGRHGSERYQREMAAVWTARALAAVAA